MKELMNSKHHTIGKARSYAGDARIAAFPLGGIGTGNVSVGARGELRDWEIFNWPGKGQFLPFSFFAIWVKPEDRTSVTRILEGKLVPPYHRSHGFLNGELAGLPRFEQSTMTGKQPFVYVDLKDSSVPVNVRMEAFTPFIPLNADDSGIPTAIIRFRVSNPLAIPTSVSVMGSLANVVGFRGYDVFNNVKLSGEVENTYRQGDGYQGLYYTAKNLNPDDFRFGNMSLVTTNSNVNSRTQWLQGQWTDNAQDFWDDFSDDGFLGAPKDIDGAGCDLRENYDWSFLNLQERIGSLGSNEVLQPGEEKVFEFVLSWYFPNRPKGWIEYDEDIERFQKGGYDIIKNYYTNHFSDAWSVAKYVVENLPRLEKHSRDFENALYSSTLPEAVLDAIATNMTTVKSNCCFRTADGNFYGWEGIRDSIGCGHGNVNHVWNYAQTVAYLFPELEISMRNIEFNFELEPDGKMPFRARRILGDDPWRMIPACDGQFGSILRVYREWKLSGDEHFLQTIWPNVIKALEYAIKEWDTDCDGVLDGKMHVTYDIEFYGPNTMTNTIYLGAIKGVAEMATHLGDKISAEKYERLYKGAAQKVDQMLWTGEYYIQKLDDVDQYRYQYGIGCLSDQLLGQFMSYSAGLGYVLPKEHIKKTLESIYRYNFHSHMDELPNVQRTYALNDEAALALCSWPKGGRPRFPFAYCDEVWAGVEYTVAVNMIREGMLEEAFQIVEAIRDRYDGYKRNPWSETEAGHHYVRSMASFTLLKALSGFEFDLAHKANSFNPVVNEDDFSCFWINGKAWGVFHQSINQKDGKVKREIETLYGDTDYGMIN